MPKMLTILLVDDMASMETELSRALSDIGIEHQIDYRCPKDPDRRFGCPLPEGAELDKFDLAIIDLELFPLKRSIEYSADDLRGGTEVLPYLRIESPWLPVIAVSRLFHSSAKHFLAVAGSFGFDGHLPREVLSSDLFNRRLWDGLVERAALLRRRAALGDEYRGRGMGTDVDVPRPLEGELELSHPGWRDTVGSLFHFAKKVVLKSLAGGYSGAKVFKSYVHMNSGGHEGEWLVKLSRSPSKLFREVRAHLNVTRTGLEYARSVPLLWSVPIVFDHTAGIAYQFARGTEEAASWLAGGGAVDELCRRLESLLFPCYRGRSRSRGVKGRLLAKWSPRSEQLRGCASELLNSERRDLLLAVADQSEEGNWGEVIEYQESWIHGDLHLSNILLGSRDVMIDFAWSESGPIAVDAARLTVDLLLRRPELRGFGVPTWLDEAAPVMKAIHPLKELFDLEEGDRQLFDDLCVLWIAASTQFDSVPDDTKIWCASALNQ